MTSPKSTRIRLLLVAMRLDRAQRWEDFRRHWPMHVLYFLVDAGCGTLLGLLCGLSVVLWALENAA